MKASYVQSDLEKFISLYGTFQEEMNDTKLKNQLSRRWNDEVAKAKKKKSKDKKSVKTTGGGPKVLYRKDEKIQVCESSQNLSGFPLSDLFTDFLRENERKTLSFCRNVYRNGDFCSNGFVMVFLLSELPAGRGQKHCSGLVFPLL